MSNNSKINEISNNVFSNNWKSLANKKPEEIQKEREVFEDQLEKMINGLDNYTRKEILLTLVKESEDTTKSFFDSNGNINIQEVKKIVTSEIIKVDRKKNKESSDLRTEKVVLEHEDNSIDNIKTSEEAKVAASKIIADYANLTTEEEKEKYIRDYFKLSEETPKETIEQYENQFKLVVEIEKLKKEGKTNEEIQNIINKDPKFNGLTKEQKQIDKDGRVLFNTQIELIIDIENLEKEIQNLQNELNKENGNEETQKYLERKKEELRLKQKQYKQIEKKTGVTQKQIEEVKNEQRKAQKGELEEGENVLTSLINLTKEGKTFENSSNSDVVLPEISKPEELKRLLEEGISKEDISNAIEILNMALLNLDEGEEKSVLHKMIQEEREQGEITLESSAVIDLLLKMPDIDKILNSDEEKEYFIDNLYSISDLIKEMEIQPEEQQIDEEPINDFEMERALASLEKGTIGFEAKNRNGAVFNFKDVENSVTNKARSGKTSEGIKVLEALAKGYNIKDFGGNLNRADYAETK